MRTHLREQQKMKDGGSGGYRKNKTKSENSTKEINLEKNKSNKGHRKKNGNGIWKKRTRRTDQKRVSRIGMLSVTVRARQAVL
jgi:hypothetical protein